MNVTFSKNPAYSFQARPVAKTINSIGKAVTKIDIWEVSNKDKVVLKQILQNTDMKKLMPNTSEIEAKRWHEMLEIAIDDTINKGQQSFLAVSENKPCGIISVVPGKNNFRTSCICTWPINCGEKVKMAGKTLFYQIFKVFEKSKARKISLQAIMDGPYNTVSKYQDLGFKINNSGRLIDMSLDRSKIKDSCLKLKKFIDYEPLKDMPNQNLADVIIV